MQFKHAMIRVKNIDESLKFYCDLLGMKIQKEMQLEDCKMYFVGYSENEFQIELVQNFETPKDGYKNGDVFGHFAFEVESLEKLDKKIKQAGIEYLYEPFRLSEEYDIKIAFVKDPDGNEIEFIESK